MAALAFNAALAVERWLLENPEWFDLDPRPLRRRWRPARPTHRPNCRVLRPPKPARTPPANATGTDAETAPLPPDLLSPPVN